MVKEAENGATGEKVRLVTVSAFLTVNDRPPSNRRMLELSCGNSRI